MNSTVANYSHTFNNGFNGYENGYNNTMNNTLDTSSTARMVDMSMAELTTATPSTANTESSSPPQLINATLNHHTFITAEADFSQLSFMESNVSVSLEVS